MSLFSDLDFVKENYPLAGYTWYGVGGNAEYFAPVQNIDQLRRAVARASEHNLDIKILGQGSNVLVRDEGVKGLVVKLEGDFSKFEFRGGSIIAGSGVNLGNLVLESVREGLGGLESLTGIPGSLGGAVKMNAGGSFGEIGTSVESVELMDMQGSTFSKHKPELVFSYRQNNIYESIITSVELSLTPADSEMLLKRVQEIWIYKKNHQPVNRRTAGCVFRNVSGRSAGEIIESCGLKGAENGKAKLSEKHCNIIIAEEGCTSSDIIGLIEKIRDKVRELADIDLQLEIDMW
ncbi:UDP-N-acetylmuramate dehydrogenase [Sedimentisphaera salicampi]|uniref:UDP-N-acetylenolpyruvoylglucosamine reductase n=1 Tax=Sedimentisphaera salicampi TaxID=1941349 RepID=A0A1W6LKC3_9BACT|nr:UDP-N-acetylmuramate dehydrogenase [Sedimentisphaera salicampi]ARN56215.1 UDP-N-acetylenolpyruvoylglucosamine reductase [Sedimentisphaera salicampi]OXU15648.1 UDP-N-acetylenolpyruvoylglucosamine reductase [Sedimentisphaera salicampi]